MEENKDSKQENTFVAKIPQKEVEHGLIMQTYKSDLSKALDTTDADSVQQLLKNAREKENFEKETITGKRQRSWYVVGALLTMLVATSAILFAFYFYKKLTVQTEKTFSVGIFQKSSPVVMSSANIENIFSQINSSESFPDGKPIVANIVSDDKDFVEIDKSKFFNFIEAKVTEPFAYQIQVIKLGFVNNKEEGSPFVILFVKDSETASKEFLIAEPDLLNIFHKSLGINIDSYKEQIGSVFESNYFYNLPVRILRDQTTKGIVMFYGYATPNIIVMTTKPSVFKSVYDTIIKQI